MLWTKPYPKQMDEWTHYLYQPSGNSVSKDMMVGPPRRGLEEGVMTALGQLRPRDILYLSCDPATLARDAAGLARIGYRPEKVRIFDQFPQTAHIESLVHLTLS